MALLGIWFEGGLSLDLWAHSRGLVALTEGFLTPWHIAFYLGYLSTAGMLLRAILINRRTGATWRAAIPAGYSYATAGALIFFVSGLADFIKHTLTGFNLAAEAPIDPSHLGITLGMGLIVGGPYFAAWLRRDQPASWAARWPAVVSLAGLLTSATLAVQFSSPLAKVWADPAVLALFHPDTIYAPSLAISGMLIEAGLLVGFFLPAIRRGVLPTGAFGAVMLYNAGLMSVQYSQYRLIPAAALAGLAFDGLAGFVRRDDSTWTWQAAGAAIPLIFFALYFGSLALIGHMGWAIHQWTATLVITAAAGWGLSLIMKR